MPGYTLADHCAHIGEVPLGGHAQVPIDLFVRYGLWFAERLVPEVEDVRVLAVDRQPDGIPAQALLG
ncbi:hypothetical protein [Streptomyces sp. MK37H]|uniref:hypothetical protein n=1 Tax=Streptomyces sp. MK37H TaxID=2699117 RepID=UPI0027E42DEA|nr:hypothetical protein [Streptomyces sp. MK37H]